MCVYERKRERERKSKREREIGIERDVRSARRLDTICTGSVTQ